jgi:transposase-like protein
VNLKTPLSRIIEILQALNEGLGVNAVCRVFGVSKSSLYRWQQRLSDLKPTLVLYALVRPAQ